METRLAFLGLLLMGMVATGCSSCGGNNQSQSPPLKTRLQNGMTTDETRLFVDDTANKKIDVYPLDKILAGETPPSTPIYIGEDVWGVLADGGYLYTGYFVNESLKGFLRRYRIGSDTSILAAGTDLEIEGIPLLIRKEGNLLAVWTCFSYGVQQTYQTGGNLYLIDVADPVVPKLLSKTHTGHSLLYVDSLKYFFSDMIILDRKLMLLQYSHNLGFDISDPSNPQPIDYSVPDDMLVPKSYVHMDHATRVGEDLVYASWTSEPQACLYRYSRDRFPLEFKKVFDGQRGQPIESKWVISAILSRDRDIFLLAINGGVQNLDMEKIPLQLIFLPSSKLEAGLTESQPKELAMSPGSGLELAKVIGDRIIIMTWREIGVVDISDPEQPKLLSKF